MQKSLSQTTISKPVAIAVVLSLAVMPWFQGGRDPVGWMVLWGVALLGGFMLWRSPVPNGTGRTEATVKAGQLGIVWLVLTGWTALSLVWSVNRYQTFTALLLDGLIAAIFILAASLRRNQLAEQIFSQTYLIIASIASAVGLIFYIVNSYDRATSTFYLPNPFAGFLLPVVIIGLWRFAEKMRLFEGILAMLNLGVFILTDSRGATLALMVAIFVGLWLSQNIARHWRRLVIVIVGALAVALIANVARSQISHHFSLQGSRFKNIASTDSNSTSDRVYFLRSAVAIWADHPLIGSGAGTYATLHPKYQYRVISAGNNVHNFYVQTLAELGLAGFLIIVWLLVELAQGLVRGLKDDPSKLPLALAILALLLHAAVDIDANYPVLWALLAILVGLCYLPKLSKTSHSVSLRSWAIGISLVTALPVIWLFQNQVHASAGADYQNLADYSRAADYYQLSHQHGPYDPDWLSAEGINDFVLANLGLDKTHNLNQALALAEAARHQDPDDGQHDLLIARILVQQGKLPQAEAADRAAIQKDPYNHPEYYNDLASVYFQENKLKLAGDTAAVVLGLYPDSVVQNRHDDPTIAPAIATSYAIAARVDVSSGAITQARQFLVHGLQLDPTSQAAKLLLKQIGQ